MPKEKRVCQADGCEREGRHVGWCNTHYWRVKRYGVPVLPERKNKRHHPNYMTWHERKVREALCDEWAGDFWKFVEDVGVRPSKRHFLYKRDQQEKYAKGNCYWERFLRRRSDETDAEWHARKWKKRNTPETERGRHYKRKFGITKEEYDRKFHEQNGVCAICLHPERFIDAQTKVIRRLAVDHCHTTGKVRDLLCFACNSALGNLRESEEIATRLIAYIRKHECERPALIPLSSPVPT